MWHGGNNKYLERGRGKGKSLGQERFLKHLQSKSQKIWFSLQATVGRSLSLRKFSMLWRSWREPHPTAYSVCMNPPQTLCHYILTLDLGEMSVISVVWLPTYLLASHDCHEFKILLTGGTKFYAINIIDFNFSAVCDPVLGDDGKMVRFPANPFNFILFLWSCSMCRVSW